VRECREPAAGPRSAQRTREIAIESLGATRWRIIRQLLGEHRVKLAVSGLMGSAMIAGSYDRCDAQRPDARQTCWMTFSIDPVVIAFFAGISIAIALFGLAPRSGLSTDVNEVMKESGGRSRHRWAANRR
jgi:hypothetical protein